MPETLFAPVRRKPLVTQVAEHFRQLISDGEWPVGFRLPGENQLASDLAVSRGTVREAVRSLALTGVLEPRVGDGTYVRARNELSALLIRDLTKSDFEHAMEVRHVLESASARLAALNASPSDIATMDDALHRRAEANSHSDTETYISADADFHTALVRASGNPMLAKLYAAVGDAMTATIRQTTSVPERKEVGNLHVALLNAVRRRDADAAELGVAAVIRAVSGSDDGAASHE